MNTKTAAAIWLLASLTLTAACSGNPQASNSSGPDKPSNALNASRSATADDPEDAAGDLNVEQLIYKNRIRSLAAAHTLLDPNGFPLIKQLPAPSIAPLKGKYAENVISAAKSYLGTPYIYGSDRTEPSSFDCSDFTRWVFLESLGMDLPWDSRSQAAYVKAFSRKTYTSLKSAKRGDLLFFSSYRGNKASDYKGLTAADKPVSHLGIYLGNGKIIHCASKKSGGVAMHPLTWRQLNNRFLFGGSILP